MTEITRNIILDLLPLYLAGEVSGDTRALVDKYLETDPVLVNVAKELAAMELSSDIPIPITEESQMKAYKQTQRFIFLRTVVIAAAIAFVLTLVFTLAVWGVVAFIFLSG
jgi:hypothetical protein